jgi:WD40 repeat protein
VRVWDIDVHPSDGTAVTVGADGTVITWAAGPQARIVGRVTVASVSVTYVRFSPDGRRLVASADDGTISVWDWADEPKVRLAQFGDLIGQGPRSVFSADGRTLVACGKLKADRTTPALCVYDLSNIPGSPPPPPRVFTGLLPNGEAEADVVLLPGDAQVAFGGGGGSLVIVDLADGKVARRFPAHGTPIWRLAVSRDGRLLASSGEDGLVRLFDTADGRLIRAFDGHHGTAYDVWFAPGGRDLLSWGSDRRLVSWDLETLSARWAIQSDPQVMYVVRPTRDFTHAIDGDANGGVHVWRLPPPPGPTPQPSAPATE